MVQNFASQKVPRLVTSVQVSQYGSANYSMNGRLVQIVGELLSMTNSLPFQNIQSLLQESGVLFLGATPEIYHFPDGAHSNRIDKIHLPCFDSLFPFCHFPDNISVKR